MSLSYEKFYLIQCKFTVGIAKCLGMSLFGHSVWLRHWSIVFFALSAYKCVSPSVEPSPHTSTAFEPLSFQNEATFLYQSIGLRARMTVLYPPRIWSTSVNAVYQYSM